jgi:hypothetical protein
MRRRRKKLLVEKKVGKKTRRFHLGVASKVADLENFTDTL